MEKWLFCVNLNKKNKNKNKKIVNKKKKIFFFHMRVSLRRYVDFHVGLVVIQYNIYIFFLQLNYTFFYFFIKELR